MPQQILYTPAATVLPELTADADCVFALCDATTAQVCAPLLSGAGFTPAATPIVIPAGDDNKDVSSLSHVWAELSQRGASRSSMLVCLGGGMVTDLGGFAAATFKRGIRFVNVPTTLLAMVDAAVGGKTGINFGGLKNEVGVFREAEAVVIDTAFLRTLDAPNLLSGFAEMLKHALLHSEDMLAEHLRFSLDEPDYAVLSRLVRQSVEVKSHIVRQDPTERGLRKALNLGHTFGHAIESLLLERATPRLHGYCVAWGLICELYLSLQAAAFPQDVTTRVSRFVRQTYGAAPITCKDYPRLLQLMRHDKKNRAGIICCTLLSAVGQLHLDYQPSEAEILEAFDFLREG